MDVNTMLWGVLPHITETFRGKEEMHSSPGQTLTNPQYLPHPFSVFQPAFAYAVRKKQTTTRSPPK